MRLIAYKYRIYPTKKQTVLLEKTFGCCRFVYNQALARKIELYQTEKRGISSFDLIKELVEKKIEFPWLKEVNSQALQASIQNLDMAYTKFFKDKKGFPKFKSKHNNHKSFTNVQNTTIDFDLNKIYFPKFKEGVKVKIDRKFEGKIKSSTVSKTPSGKYFISILVEENVTNSVPPAPEENLTLGIDLGIKDFATFSNGTKIKNPKHLVKQLKKLKRKARQHGKKKKGSNNRDKSRIKLARVYEKISNCRKDFLHKLSKSIVENQDYTSVAMEDLSILNMVKNKKQKAMNRAIYDVGWYIFKEFLKYKCKRKGKNLLIIGRFDPSSKLCTCGKLKQDLTLSDRVWTCDSCGTTHDRDVLASQNIVRFAFCKQNFLPLERREVTLGESCVSDSLNQESLVMG